jgi:photosystem II stability/assembly factor-like uncharacterized protein
MKNFRILLLVLPAFLTANFAPAQNWMLISGTTNINWSAIASSADGSKLAAVGYNGTNAIYISTNSGATWLPGGAPSRYWSSIASSADGTRLVAAAMTGEIYTSTDSGATWWSNSVPPWNNWNAVASSADGARLAAVPYTPRGPVYVSMNFGNTWTATGAPITNWYSIASSANGSILLAGTDGGSAYLSTNSGNTWMQQTNLPAARWNTMATSADGRVLMAVAYQVGSGPGRIYLSTNSGGVWIQTSTPTNLHYMASCASADGTKMAAIESRRFVYSTNSGNTWSSNNAPRLDVKWGGMVYAADGNKLVLAADNPGGIYTLQTTPALQMNLTPANGNLKLSWIVPSTDFILQQSSNLAGWSDVADAPVLNLTNLQNEVVLSPTNSRGFYRLKTP